MSLTELVEYIDGYIEDLAPTRGRGNDDEPGAHDEFDRGYINGMKTIRDDLEGWIIEKKRS